MRYTAADNSGLPGMLATLCSYESLFGAYHPQTLCLMTEVAVACWRQGEATRARSLLERAIRDLGRVLGPDHDLRLRAIVAFATSSSISAIMRMPERSRRNWWNAGAGG